MNKTILLVDDSPTLRLSVRFLLHDDGFRVIEARDGIEGLRKLNDIMRDNIKIQMIITDINMPGMDGLTFIKKVKQIDELKFIPIIVLSTEFGDDKKMEAKGLGVAGWLRKPFRDETIKKIVKKFVR